MKKQRKAPAYSAKPGQSETVKVKDYGPPQIVSDTGWGKNVLTGFKERTTVEKHGDAYIVKRELEGGIYLKPVGAPLEENGILSFSHRGSNRGKTRTK